jgi:hypothetical protein
LESIKKSELIRTGNAAKNIALAGVGSPINSSL